MILEKHIPPLEGLSQGLESDCCGKPTFTMSYSYREYSGSYKHNETVDICTGCRQECNAYPIQTKLRTRGGKSDEAKTNH